MSIHGIDIVYLNVAFLIGLDRLSTCEGYFGTVHVKLCLPDLNIEVSQTPENVHIFLEWPSPKLALLIRQKEIKLECGFLHPTYHVMRNLLRLPVLSEFNPETSYILSNTSKNCRSFQHYGPSPIGFKATTPLKEQLVFGGETPVYQEILDG